MAKDVVADCIHKSSCKKTIAVPRATQEKEALGNHVLATQMNGKNNFLILSSIAAPMEIATFQLRLRLWDVGWQASAKNTASLLPAKASAEAKILAGTKSSGIAFRD